MSIPLPPLPETHMHDGVRTHWLSSDFLRARDLEIVRCVLEAAAKAALSRADAQQNKGRKYASLECAAAIRALEFRHHE